MWVIKYLYVNCSFFKEHGPDWRKFADEFGKYRIHVKDTWRRINVPNKKEGILLILCYSKAVDLHNAVWRLQNSSSLALQYNEI